MKHLRLSVVIVFLFLPVFCGAQTWSRVAAENGFFTVPPSTVVRYGADPKWVVRTLGGTVQCTNAFFGSDPALMTVKTCEVQTAAPAPSPAPIAKPPACWPAQVAGGGTPAKTVVIAPSDAASAPAGAEPVHVVWWYCAEPLDPTGWKLSYYFCEQSKLTQCLLGLPTLNPTALTTAWKASPPSNASDSPSVGWAYTAWRRLHADPGRPPKPPAESWVVAKAATNANPAGTRPAFILNPPDLLVDLYSTERVKEGDVCDCNKARLLRGSLMYCQTGTRDDKVAVCSKR